MTATIVPPAETFAAPTSRSLLVYYIVYLISIAIPVVVLAYMLFYWVPKYREMLKDFKVALPALTEWALYVATMLESPPVWLPLLGVVLALPLIPAAIQRRFKTRTQHVTGFMIFVLILLFVSFSSFMLIQLAMFLPMVKLVQSVSGAGGGDG
jgi:type II secretory pathway component PulF